MKIVRFEFELDAPSTAELLDRLPEALRDHSVAVDLCPAVPGPGHATEPWVRLLWACAVPGLSPGRWACDQVLQRWQAESLDAVAASLEIRRDPATLTLPQASGARPALVLGERRFSGQDALAQLVAALAA